MLSAFTMWLKSKSLKIITYIYSRGYPNREYPYQAIVGLLEKQDGVQMHVRTLKRKLKDLGLKRKAANYDEDIVRELIKQEMQGADSLAGYRYIWHALRLRHHVNVPRSQVASIMKEIDPQGVQERRSRRLKRRAYLSYGPNFCWHLDGRCKLGYKSNKSHSSLKALRLGAQATDQNCSYSAKYTLPSGAHHTVLIFIHF